MNVVGLRLTQSFAWFGEYEVGLLGGATGGEQVDDIGEFSRGQCGVGG